MDDRTEHDSDRTEHDEQGTQEPKGIYGKYHIVKADGSPTDPKAVYFVLRLDTDPFARRAMVAYAAACEEDQPALAADILRLVRKTNTVHG